MEAAEQARAYAAADLSELHQGFVEAFASRIGQPRGRCLDLGCGTADISLRLARACPGLQIVGVDGSEAMLAEGRAAVAAAGLEARISLELRRLPDETLPRHAYDVVVSNSLLHHLADPLVLWRTLRDCAVPGAPLLVMDLRRPASVAAARELVARHGEHAAPVLVKDFLNSLRAAYRLGEVRQQLRTAQLSRCDSAEIGEIHWIVWGRV